MDHMALEDDCCIARADLNHLKRGLPLLQSRSSCAFRKGIPSPQMHRAMGPCTPDSSLPSALKNGESSGMQHSHGLNRFGMTNELMNNLASKPSIR